jgi:trimeric autotransporter adhesin
MRAHYRAPVQDDGGNLLPGSVITVFVNGTTSPLGLPVYSDDSTTSLLANPWTSPDGNIDFYLDAPQRVDLQVAPPGEAAVVFPDIDVEISGSTSVELTFVSTGTQSTALGSNSAAAGNYAAAFGDSSTAPGTDSLAAGQSASASGLDATAIGQQATVPGNASTALGQRSAANGQQAVAVGTAAVAAADNTVVVGAGASASGTGAVALGQGANATGAGAVAIGAGASAPNPGEIVLGNSGSTVVIAGTLSAPGAIAFYGLFGSGSGGAVVLDGATTYPNLTLAGSTYTMSAGFLASPPSSLTINAGITLNTAGLPLQVDGPVINNGTITNAGFSASGSSPGNLAGSLMYFAGAGAAGTANAGAAAAAMTSIAAGAGGAGGSSPAKGNGGAGGIVSSSPGTAPWRLPYAALTGVALWKGQIVPLGGGAGGGSGSGDGTNPGGGGGSGGGVVVIAARSLVNNGLITAAGGNGATPIAGNTGGGGGGGGGTVVIFTLATAGGTGTVSVSPGTGGGNHGTGIAGGPGSAGQVIEQLVS